MSEIIVSKITSPEGEPLIIDGSRVIKVDTIQTHLGAEKPVANLTTVRAGIPISEVEDFGFLVDPVNDSLTIKTPTGNVTLKGYSTDGQIDKVHSLSTTNYNVTTAWTNLPMNLNVADGSYAIQLRVNDQNGSDAIYTGLYSHIHMQANELTSDMIEELTLARAGSDSVRLQLRAVQTVGSTGIKFQIRADSTPAVAHQKIEIRVRQLL